MRKRNRIELAKLVDRVRDLEQKSNEQRSQLLRLQNEPQPRACIDFVPNPLHAASFGAQPDELVTKYWYPSVEAARCAARNGVSPTLSYSTYRPTYTGEPLYSGYTIYRETVDGGLEFVESTHTTKEIA